jgi:uncharacterized protein
LVTKTVSEAGPVRDTVAQLLRQRAAGIPWLIVSRGPAGEAEHVTTIDLRDPHGTAVTVNPLQPEPGFPLATHASLVWRLWQAAYDLQGTIGDVLALALLRAYENCGWDPATGQAVLGAEIPSLRDLKSATAVAAGELGCSDETAALARGFVQVRLGELSGNGAGLLLGGGHPADMSAVLRRNVRVITGAMDEACRALVAGTIVLRAAEHVHQYPGGPRPVLVIEDGERLFGGRLDGLIADAAAEGLSVVLAGVPLRAIGAGNGAAVPAERQGAAGLTDAATVLVSERRSPACGLRCVRMDPCTRGQIRAAARIASGADGEPMRRWAAGVVVAFLTWQDLPVPPRRLRQGWMEADCRLRECALATVISEVVAERVAIVRGVYPAALLTRVTARAATALLDGRRAPVRAGQCWVPPLLRWVHEARRSGWNGFGWPVLADASDIAPPLDFRLSGLADWPGIRLGQRLALLLRHPLSAEVEHNSSLVARVLGGDARSAR